MAALRDVLRRVARPPEEIRAENLRRWASTIPGTVPIAEIKPRSRCLVAGVVQNIRIDPRDRRDSIEATIIDGSGSMIAKWLGRSSLSGIRLGVGLIVEGVVGTQEDELIILNPEYRLVTEPEHG